MFRWRYEDFRSGEHAKRYVRVFNTDITRKKISMNRKKGIELTLLHPAAHRYPLLSRLSLLDQPYQLRRQVGLQYRVLIRGRPVLFLGWALQLMLGGSLYIMVG